jgi:hypothetical protein
LGEPMRLEAPPERITAASMSFFLGRLFRSVGLVPTARSFETDTGVPCPYKSLVGAYGLALLDSNLFVGGVLRVAAHGD